MTDQQLAAAVRENIDAVRYYQLFCETCTEPFQPMLGTEPDDLLIPDYEKNERTFGVNGTESFRKFHEKHCGHALIARPDPEEILCH